MRMTARLSVLAVACALCAGWEARADDDAGALASIVPAGLLGDALTARAYFLDQVRDLRRVTIIDYRRPSNERRMFMVDLESGTAEALLVAHGKGSDPDNDGWADQFSDILGSKMSSLGAYVTGEAYEGRHGVAVRLHGLEPSNLHAYERAIVIHGADYVDPSLEQMGRSWGCPAVEQRLATHVVESIADGTFLFIIG